MIVRNRSMCAHERFAIPGCAVCLHCGMDLDKALDVIRANSLKVTIPDRDQQADEEPYTPTFAESLATWPRWLIYALSAIFAIAAGLSVAEGLVYFL